MKNSLFSPLTSGLLGGLSGFAIMALVFITVSSVVAAPTQAPPNGNPTFPITGPQGPQGPQGPTGPTGPQGTWAPNRCQVCMQACDFNGNGPCSQACATEGYGWGSWGNFFGDVDGNDVFRVLFDCW